jgi:3-dehydroquinate synthetase
LLIRLGLPVSVSGYSLDEVHATMFFDKKRQGKTLRFILPTRLGDVKIVNDPGEEYVRRALAVVLN